MAYACTQPESSMTLVASAAACVELQNSTSARVIELSDNKTH